MELFRYLSFTVSRHQFRFLKCVPRSTSPFDFFEYTKRHVDGSTNFGKILVVTTAVYRIFFLFVLPPPPSILFFSFDKYFLIYLPYRFIYYVLLQLHLFLYPYFFFLQICPLRDSIYQTCDITPYTMFDFLS